VSEFLYNAQRSLNIFSCRKFYTSSALRRDFFKDQWLMQEARVNNDPGFEAWC